MPRKIDTAYRTSRKVRLLVCVSLFLGSAARAGAEEWTVDAVMSALRGLKYAEATFKEVRHSSFLKKPLDLKGTFIYKAPRTFIKETFKPYPETVTVDANGVKIEQEKAAQEGQSRTQFIAADAHPLVQGLVDSAEATMSGKKELLEARYEIELNGTGERWRVILVPKEKALRKKLDSLSFEGSGDLIRHAEINEADGDRSIIDLDYLKVERN